jgi:small-conductance mechanosensitive channel
MSTVTDVFVSTVETFLDDTLAAVPSLLSGALVLIFAYLFIRLVRYGLRSILRGMYPMDQQLIADFVLIVVTIFLWFGAGLVALSVLGLDDIAASLGTAAGFIALGVSYALSEMIEDTVAGIYLLQDPDFNPGDRVTAHGVTGTVTAIGLRKSRFELDNGDTAVYANHDIESKWTKHDQEEAGDRSG